METRRDGDGKRLGPKPAWLAQMTHDEKQLLCPVEPRVLNPRACPCCGVGHQETDISGHVMAE